MHPRQRRRQPCSGARGNHCRAPGSERRGRGGEARRGAGASHLPRLLDRALVGLLLREEDLQELREPARAAAPSDALGSMAAIGARLTASRRPRLAPPSTPPSQRRHHGLVLISHRPTRSQPRCAPERQQAPSLQPGPDAQDKSREVRAPRKSLPHAKKNAGRGHLGDVGSAATEQAALCRARSDPSPISLMVFS